MNMHDVSILLLSSILYLRTCVYGHSFFVLSEVLRETKKDTIFLRVPFYVCMMYVHMMFIDKDRSYKKINWALRPNLLREIIVVGVSIWKEVLIYCCSIRFSSEILQLLIFLNSNFWRRAIDFLVNHE